MGAPTDAFEDSPLRQLPVRLALFEGPLDLLLHLCRDNKVDITDIPIAAITEQYLAYLDMMRTLNLEVAGEFLVVAATLLHIKSRLLLPVEETPEGEEGDDPRRDLVRQLLEYQRFKEAGLALRGLEERRSAIFARESLGPEGPPRTDYPLEVSMIDLLAALRRVIEQMPKTQQVQLEPDRLSVAQRIAEVLELMAAGGELRFEELFRGAREVGDVVVTFLAVLELVRLRLVRIWQAVAYGEIRVAAVPAGAEAQGAPAAGGVAGGTAAAGADGTEDTGEPTEEPGHTEEREGD
jgi:segregation and condensation protein A